MKRVLASFMFFTRLPLWRVVEVPSAYFSRVVELWPYVGWLTGGIAALMLYWSSYLFSPFVSVLIALLARMLLTGALHEDGLADFCDGFGGGSCRESILLIMKDSHIGSYGVLGLITYVLLIVGSWISIPVGEMCLLIVAGDAWSKFCAAQIINFLPYARKADEAKNGTVYQRFSPMAWAVAFVGGALPAFLIFPYFLGAYIAPPIAVIFLILLFKKKIGGYTGDCCGATFLISELIFYLTASAIWRFF